jgi:hypothetical protein
VIPSQPAPWPCIGDVAALRKSVADSAPDAVVLSPGWLDAVYGTPVDLFAQAVDFAVAIARQRCRRVVVVLPGNLGQQDFRHAYAEAVQDVARRHQVACIEPWADSAAAPEQGAAGYRWPSAAAQRAFADRTVSTLFRRWPQ